MASSKEVTDVDAKNNNNTKTNPEQQQGEQGKPYGFKLSIEFGFSNPDDVQNEGSDAQAVLRSLQRVMSDYSSGTSGPAVNVKLDLTHPEAVEDASFTEAVQGLLQGGAATGTTAAGQKKIGELDKPLDHFHKFDELTPEIRRMILDLAKPRRVFTPINLYERQVGEAVCRLQAPPFSQVCREWRRMAHETGRMMYFFETFKGWMPQDYARCDDVFAYMGPPHAETNIDGEPHHQPPFDDFNKKPRAYASWIDFHHDILQFPWLLDDMDRSRRRNLDAYQMRYLVQRMHNVAVDSAWLQKQLQPPQGALRPQVTPKHVFGVHLYSTRIRKIYVTFDENRGGLTSGAINVKVMIPWLMKNLEYNLCSRVIFDLRKAPDVAELRDLDRGGFYDDATLDKFIRKPTIRFTPPTVRAFWDQKKDRFPREEWFELRNTWPSLSFWGAEVQEAIKNNAVGKGAGPAPTLAQQASRPSWVRRLYFEYQHDWLHHAWCVESERREWYALNRHRITLSHDGLRDIGLACSVVNREDQVAHIRELIKKLSDLATRAGFGHESPEDGLPELFQSGFGAGPFRWTNADPQKPFFEQGPIIVNIPLKPELKKILMWWNQYAVNRRPGGPSRPVETRYPHVDGAYHQMPQHVRLRMSSMPEVIPCVLLVDPRMQGQGNERGHGFPGPRGTGVNAGLWERNTDRVVWQDRWYRSTGPRSQAESSNGSGHPGGNDGNSFGDGDDDDDATSSDPDSGGGALLATGGQE